jgi:hypothetical protein
MSEDTIKEFTKRIEMFQKGFEMIAQSLQTQLEKVVVSTDKLAINTSFMPKIVESNKEIKKMGEKLQLLTDGLISRLDAVGK